jgi:hypothetical protein
MPLFRSTVLVEAEQYQAGAPLPFGLRVLNPDLRASLNVAYLHDGHGRVYAVREGDWIVREGGEPPFACAAADFVARYEPL